LSAQLIVRVVPPFAYGDEYAETMVWEYNEELRQRGKLIFQGDSARNSSRVHINVCSDLYEYGEVKSYD